MVVEGVNGKLDEDGAMRRDIKMLLKGVSAAWEFMCVTDDEYDVDSHAVDVGAAIALAAAYASPPTPTTRLCALPGVTGENSCGGYPGASSGDGPSSLGSDASPSKLVPPASHCCWCCSIGEPTMSFAA